MNEPADESRAVVGPFYDRLSTAIREIDPEHILFFDGNTYSTEFGFFGEPLENAVYTLHDYVPAGLGRADEYPGPEAAEAKFLERSEYARRTGTPIYVGEFAPIYTGDEAVDAERRRILDDQLQIYKRYGAGFATWMYKDLGRQGLTSVRPDSPYGELVADFVAKKRRLGVDQWGAPGARTPTSRSPSRTWSRARRRTSTPTRGVGFDFVRTLVLNITLAQPLAGEYAELFRGLGEDELIALADSWAFENCVVRESLRDQQAGRELRILCSPSPPAGTTRRTRGGSGCQAEDLVDDARDGRRGVDDDAAWGVFSRLVQPLDELTFRLPSAPLVFRSPVEPPVQCVEIDLKDEDAVEQADEVRGVPRPPQKNVSGSAWSATKALTLSTRQRWCSCVRHSTAAPVAGSPWYASSRSPWMAW